MRSADNGSSIAGARQLMAKYEYTARVLLAQRQSCNISTTAEDSRHDSYWLVAGIRFMNGAADGPALLL
jgi:hypothetical protein